MSRENYQVSAKEMLNTIKEQNLQEIEIPSFISMLIEKKLAIDTDLNELRTAVSKLFEVLKNQYTNIFDELKQTENKIEKIINDKELEHENAVNLLDDFQEYIQRPRKEVSTGFRDLDKMLGGGLFSGLYVIYAGTGIGKTTFCHQIADNVAKQKHPVLYFTLEMSQNELIAKSLSRLTYELCAPSGYSTRDILNFGKAPDERLTNALNAYKETIAPNMYITEGIFSLTIENICDKISSFVVKWKCKPIIFIDYLQIIQCSEFFTDRAAITKITSSLKRLQRKYDLTIIVISSVSRANYSQKLDISSGKESGMIEFSADFVLGLEYAKLVELFEQNAIASKTLQNEAMKKIQQQKENAEPIEILVSNFKNRHGNNSVCKFDFLPRYNIFFDYIQKDDNEHQHDFDTCFNNWHYDDNDDDEETISL